MPSAVWLGRNCCLSHKKYARPESSESQLWHSPSCQATLPSTEACPHGADSLDIYRPIWTQSRQESATIENHSIIPQHWNFKTDPLICIYITSTVVCGLGKSIDITIIAGFLFLLLPCQHLLYRYTNWWFSRPWPCHCTICCAYSLDSEYMSKKVPNYSSDDNILKVYHMSHHCKTGAIYEPCRYL